MEKENQKKEIKSYIKYMKSASFEELYRVFSDALFTYFKCLTTFGINNPYTKECFNVVKEMKQVIKKEKHLLTVLNNHIDTTNLDDLDDMIDELDELNIDTYLDYSDILDNIYVSCEAKDDSRIVRGNKPINSLITNNEYEEKVYTLVQKGSIKK